MRKFSLLFLCIVSLTILIIAAFQQKVEAFGNIDIREVSVPSIGYPDMGDSDAYYGEYSGDVYQKNLDKMLITYKMPDDYMEYKVAVNTVVLNNEQQKAILDSLSTAIVRAFEGQGKFKMIKGIIRKAVTGGSITRIEADVVVQRPGKMYGVVVSMESIHDKKDFKLKYIMSAMVYGLVSEDKLLMYSNLPDDDPQFDFTDFNKYRILKDKIFEKQQICSYFKDLKSERNIDKPSSNNIIC